MLSWAIILLFALVAGLVLKFSHVKHKFTLVLFVLFVLFLFASISVVSKSNDLELDSVEGIFDATKFYFSWLGSGIQNMKRIAGNVINFDWEPEIPETDLFNLSEIAIEKTESLVEKINE